MKSRLPIYAATTWLRHGYRNQNALNYFRLQGRADVLFNIFQSDAPHEVYRRIARDMRRHLWPVLVRRDGSSLKKNQAYAVVFGAVVVP